MRSKTLWLTDLGLTQVGSGELSPGLDPIELRFYPSYGLALDEWDFEVGVTSGKNPLVSLTKDAFNEEDNYFSLKLLFKETDDKSRIQIYATHKRTDFRKIIWEGDILPNKFYITNSSVGLSLNWEVISGIKAKYPNANLGHFKLPMITARIHGTAIIVASANSVMEHHEENAPIIVKGFHPHQDFNIFIDGHVFGYGGKGGNAGMSTPMNGEVEIIYPTDGLDGGNPIFVEHASQVVNIIVTKYGHYQPGHGGRGASSFMINDPTRRFNQLGNAGVGGYPNGLNGEYTDTHYRTKAVKNSKHASIDVFGINNYKFVSPVIDCQLLPIFPENKSIQQTKDGVCGNPKPKGVNRIFIESNVMPLSQLVYAYGAYVEM